MPQRNINGHCHHQHTTGSGTNGSITLCPGPAVSLFAQLGGSPDAGGAWSGPSPVAGGMFDPATMLAGVYTYTVAGLAPCPSEDATVTVTINTPPDPGTSGSITLCSTDPAVSLFAQLGGSPDAGGTWSGPSPVGGGMFDPANMSPGVYTYTVLGVVPCPNATSTVTVTINTPPDPGTNGSITLCSTDPAVSLFAQLGGSPDAGGAWSGPSPVAGGMFDPANMNAGVYTYTVAGLAPCPSEDATVTVTINTPPDPGTNGSITLCSTDPTVSLFAQLGGSPDAGGAWSGPSPVVGGMFDPSTMSAGVYTYTVAGIAPCPPELATVTVVLNPIPDAGISGAIALCATSPPTSLFAQLGGIPDAGGSWSGPSPVVGGMFDPTTMVPGLYTYTINGILPCPTVSATVNVNVVLNPDAGTPGSETLCASASAISLFGELGGTPDAGGTWSGPSPVVGGLFDPANMSAGVYTYTIAVPPPCVNASSTVTINVVQPPDAGADGALTLCISSPATQLFSSIGGSPDAGGTWSGPSPVIAGMFNPANMSAGVYTYAVAGTTPCPSDNATVTVTVVAAPDAGTPGSATLCATDAPIDLYNELGGTPDLGGAWSGPSPVVGGLFDPANMSAGVYTYTIAVPPPCVNASSAVTINVVQPPDAGADGALTLCISSPAAALFSSLGGSPDAGGTWSGPSPVIAGMFNPSNMSAGVYTYTVAGTTPCPSDNATVTVTVVAAPDAGTPGNATLCATDAPIDLYNELGGTPDAGGTWSGPSPVVSGLFDPANMSAGVYTYTIVVPPPCVNASSTVTINVVQPPDAGLDGALTLCISSPATALFSALGGSPDAGGTWSGPSPVIAGMFNPANMSAGVYTYTVAGTTPCPSDNATVTVTVVAAPDAGTPGSATLCATDGAIDLYVQLGGTPDAGGTWSGPSPVVGGLFDPANMSAGVYTYTIVVPPPCINVSSTVTLNVVQPPDAGADGALTLCISSPAAALFAALGGSPDAGGTWSGPSPVVGGLFNPGNMSAGVYTYTVAGTTPCPSDNATVTVTVVAAPDAGTPGSATLCATDGAIDLYMQLGGTPDLGGAWSGPSPVIGGLFDPANMSAGVYTYTISVPPPCVDVSSTVTVGIVPPPDAGVDAAILLCISSPATDLFNILGGSPDAGGSWLDPNGIAHSGLFDPAVDVPGGYTYTVTGTSPCPNATATAAVAVATLPDPGLPGAVTLCASDGAIGLFAQLGGIPDPGGAWTDPNGLPFAGTFDPALHQIGTYTYTIAVPPPCSSVSTTVDVDVIQPPDPGSNGILIACITGAAVDLFGELTGTPDVGGSWLDPNGNAHSGTFDPAIDLAGNYTYTVAGVSPCPDLSSVVGVSIVIAPDAGLDGILNLCLSGAGDLLFASLGGTPDAGGNWTDPNGNVFSGFFTPGVDAAGDYTYTVNGTAPCPSDDAVVTVNVLTNADAGIDGNVTVCADAAPVDLFNVLQGSPDPGGLWLDPYNQPCSGPMDPALAPQGIYTYVLYVPPPCVSDTSLVEVAIVQPPDAGLDSALTLCSTDASVVLFNLLGGNPDAGGSWTDPNGIAFGGSFDPAVDLQGTYAYTVLAITPCANATATVAMTVEPMPDAGTDGSTVVCPEAPPVDLFSLLGGTPDTGGSWLDPNGNASNGVFDPDVDPQGAYVYTVFGLTACPNISASATVNIFIVTPPNAGPDAVTCDLQYTLAATGNWNSGFWTGPSTATITDPDSASTGVTSTVGGSALFVFTIVSPDNCAASDSVLITFTEAIVPVAATTDAVCNAACDGTAAISVSGGNVGNAGYSYQWSNGVAGLTDAIAMDLCAGSYSVLVLDTNLCNTPVAFVINEPPPLLIDTVLAVNETCPGSCDGTLMVIDPQGEQYSFDGGITFGSSATMIDLCAGTYPIVMLDANGCIAKIDAVVLSPPPVIADFYAAPDSVLVSDPTVQFVNTSSNATEFVWDFSGLGSSADIDPTFTFPDVLGDTYTVCLIASNANGCTDTICAPVVVLDLLAVHVPNTFTPNGDGTNDGFMPIFNEPALVLEFEFLIFDRWGEQLWKSTTVHEPWNASYLGTLVETEVYVWKLHYRDARTRKEDSVIGHVTVLK
ncbi:MAG: gliding motility-associated C-terminal domain-containing protein [Flavobacteriales bacterium]|nr:gliding motility-associated C-terminal domain-containing protein [Flavobacteriales bacterium]